ncbi:MAG: M20/M25/M40 family metallo-hydrolase [Deltaproteobacteria bacterium]|nr:M20/M25/M40 family metallo-hydrolase [Deltaproteobacteria bacterium]
MDRSKTYDRVIEIIDKDREELVDLCLTLGNTPSPHGKEIRVAEKVLDWLKKNAINGFLQPITEESTNAVAVIPGSDHGTSLILNAHMDVGPELGPGASEAARKMEGAWTEGDLIFGKGVINDKAQLCAFMIAARAIKKAGIQLLGDLIITAVAFETGAASVDESQGINYPGEGFGTKWLVERGVTADYALVGETSGFGVVRAECGNILLKINVKGRSVYTPRLERGSSLREHPNASLKTAHVILALEDWAIKYEQKERYDFSGGTIVPKAQVMGVRYSGGNCDLYFEVRLVPQGNPRVIKRDIEQLIRNLDIDCDVFVYQYSRGYVAKDAEPLITAIEDAHRYVFGTDPSSPPSAETSMWRDLNVFNEVDIPSVCYGPPRQKESLTGAQDRAMKISDLVAATKVYALTILSVCEEGGS